ncbi:MAG TPA: SRPBCC family protein [Fimbriimonas sp.]|nr:SRPBCC family protein [Fimbriimonas sp.]
MVAVRPKTKEINASDVEHIAALTVGGLLFVSGIRRGGALGSLFKVGGLALLFRGQQGYGRLYNAMGIPLCHSLTGIGKQNVRVESSIVVNRPRAEIYRIWRNLQNLPVFMDHLVSVHELDDDDSLWVARAPAGMVIKWQARIINDLENELIAWETVEGSGVDHAGSVRFEDAGKDQTLVRIVLRYDPPADMLGAWIGKIFHNDPQSQIDRDLARFKAIMELGGRSAQKQAHLGSKSVSAL